MTTSSRTSPVYTLEDCGCYVDGSRGIYATDEIVSFARSHGAEIDLHACLTPHAESCFKSEFAGCEFAGEYEDEADAFMNERFAVDGASWGRSESGDWGLWACDED